jgi:hypothetical protein
MATFPDERDHCEYLLARVDPAMLRIWARGIVIRIDSACSDEGAGVQMMFAQPFQF